MTLTTGEHMATGTVVDREQQIACLRSLQTAVCLRDPSIGHAFGDYYMSFEQPNAEGQAPIDALSARSRQHIRERLRAYGDFVTEAFQQGW